MLSDLIQVVEGLRQNEHASPPSDVQGLRLEWFIRFGLGMVLRPLGHLVAEDISRITRACLEVT